MTEWRDLEIIESDTVPPDTAFVIAPTPVDDPDHPDHVPLERRAAKIAGLPLEDADER